jgi:hypothetical protein
VAGIYLSEDAWCKAVCVVSSERWQKGLTDRCLLKFVYHCEIVSSNIETVCYFRSNVNIYFHSWVMVQNYGGLVCQWFEELCCLLLDKVTKHWSGSDTYKIVPSDKCMTGGFFSSCHHLGNDTML